ncbi:tRNA dihydrouridine synthase DusB [uncultured Methanobrevibacter sp.]|uniref:tRNA dihydrouridine synthase DusB n=1 Tax=uncultured Methanobrevibacter sp. TaxID=253161 RepID=UPI0025E58A9A|nr:tRNA dihydrouridine synthase DusB [uncultured Methanobrevibacter sp.]
MKWNIGNVQINNQVVLAPMAGICDFTFRSIIKSMGCGLISGEMVSSNAIAHKDKNSLKLLKIDDNQRPISQQIFGSEIKYFKTAAKYVYENMNPDIIDINMGCPVPKVALKSNAGCALLKNPQKAYEVTKALVDFLPIPVTVKIRSGWDKDHINPIEISTMVEKAGASAITIHPRDRTQAYSGVADWDIIKDVKDSIDIPVIGNGDIRSCYAAKAMIDYTGCDAIMIGRGVLGNPWLIKECIAYLDEGIKAQKPNMDDRINMIKKHSELLIEDMGEEIAIKRLRSHVAYYLKGLPRTVYFKPQIFKTHTKEELFDLLDEYRLFAENL